jgi:uncharacterized membrane protein YtjA (UPF0391 family)
MVSFARGVTYIIAGIRSVSAGITNIRFFCGGILFRIHIVTGYSSYCNQNKTVKNHYTF